MFRVCVTLHTYTSHARTRTQFICYTDVNASIYIWVLKLSLNRTDKGKAETAEIRILMRVSGCSLCPFTRQYNVQRTGNILTWNREPRTEG